MCHSNYCIYEQHFLVIVLVFCQDLLVCNLLIWFCDIVIL